MALKKNRSVLLCGMAGFNLGDDAIADAIISSIRDIGNERDIFCTVQEFDVLKSSGIKQILLKRKSIKYHINLFIAVLRSDIVIIGGGSIIQDEFGANLFKGITSLFVEIVWIAKFLRKQIISAPIGVDRLYSARGKWLAAFVLNGCDMIFVRDKTSYDNVATIIDPSRLNRCQLSADPVFSLAAGGALGAVGDGLVLCPAFEGRNEEVLISLHIWIVTEYLTRFPNRTCTFVAMDSREREDAGKLKKLMSYLPGEIRKSVSLVVPADYIAAAEILRRNRAVIAMRLHAAILTCGYAPIFVISRGTKTEAICSETSIPFESFAGAESIATVQAAVSRFFANLGSERIGIDMSAREEMIGRYLSFKRYLVENI